MPHFRRLWPQQQGRELIRFLLQTSGRSHHPLQSCLRRSTALSHSAPDSRETTCLEKTVTESSHRWKPQSLSRQQLSDHILGNILFENEHLLAINKPNGLPIFVPPHVSSSWIHIGMTNNDSDHNPEVRPETGRRDSWAYRPHETSLSLLDILVDLREHLACPSLHLGMPLSRLYSGIVLLTKTEDAKRSLKKFLEMTRSQKVFFQTFLCLTAGIPIGEESGTDRVACQLAQIDDDLLTVPSMKMTKKLQKEGSVMHCELDYSVCKKNTNLNCSLFELKSTKDKWDILEWYCTRRLCAVLGDHVYSPRVGSVLGVPTHVEPHVAVPKTQTLPKKLLQRLKLSDTTVDGLPLHLHRRCIELRGIPNKGSPPITITAPLPEFFSHSLKALHLLKAGDSIEAVTYSDGIS